MVKHNDLLTQVSPSFMPMLDLFQQLRQAGMKLTIEQYELLRQVLAEGYELSDWEDLRDVCQILWVKPSLNYDIDIFNREFDRYQQQYQEQLVERFPQLKDRIHADPKRIIPLGVFPQIPTRRKTVTTVTDSPKSISHPINDGGDVVEAVKVERSTFTVEVPIKQELICLTWRSLQRSLPATGFQELDINATVESICRSGFFSDLVTRPIFHKQAKLLLLVDNNNAMLPFNPVLQPLVQSVLNRRIFPAEIYWFNRYPTNYLYDWHKPLRGVSLDRVLGRLNKQRTMAIVVSDAGAANPLYSQERVIGTSKFLQRLVPRVREVVWLNPVPKERWTGTTAEPIQTAMAGRMLPLEARQWQQLARRGEFRSMV